MTALESQIKPLLARFLPSAASENVALLFNASNEQNFKTVLRQNAALAEVSQGIFLIFELLLPTRNMILVFLWWQYLRLRYYTDKSGDLKEAFRSLDQKILGVISHRLCPKLIFRLYDMLRKFLADKVKPPQPHTGTPSTMTSTFTSMLSGLKSKCSIM